MTGLFADNPLFGGGWSWLGAGLAVMFAVGCLLVLVGLPINRRPGLDARLAPYLRDTARPSRLLAVRRDSGSPGWLLILNPVIQDLGRGVERMLGGATSVRRRMERAVPVFVLTSRAFVPNRSCGASVVGCSDSWWPR